MKMGIKNIGLLAAALLVAQPVFAGVGSSRGGSGFGGKRSENNVSNYTNNNYSNNYEKQISGFYPVQVWGGDSTDSHVTNEMQLSNLSIVLPWPLSRSALEDAISAFFGKRVQVVGYNGLRIANMVKITSALIVW